MAWYFGSFPYSGDRMTPEDIDIPDRPSPQHQYVEGEWVLEPLPQWDNLMNSLRGTPIYAKVYTAANDPEANTVAALKKTLQANTALTLLQDSMKFQNLADLQFAIATLRSVMSSISTIGDFTAEELAWINQQLSENGFQFQLS